MNDLIIEIDKVNYGFRFNMATIKIFTLLNKGEFFDLQAMLVNAPHVVAMNIIIAAHDVYTRGRKRLNDYEVGDLVEKMSQDDLLSIYNHFVDSIKILSDKIKIEGEEEKKS
jgi:hypothetical protein